MTFIVTQSGVILFSNTTSFCTEKTSQLNCYTLTNNRLYFIDAVRAFAILMMLQGHFIDTLLAVEFRDPTNTVFSIWQYFRGITAPMFFTISGLIFTYLLLKAIDNAEVNKRLQKGFNRGIMLIAIGYALRMPIFRWFSGQFDTYFLVIDVLQCIGLSLILIVLLFKFLKQNKFIFSILMLIIGTSTFLFEPVYRNYDAEGIPLIFANYLSKINGSVFTIIPWFGYMSIGAFLATLFYHFRFHKKFKQTTVIILIFGGLLLVKFSTHILKFLGQITEIELFTQVSNFNYLFIRLGNVLVIFGLFYAFESYLKQTLILKIGQKTLSIYVIHFIVLYGSFTGLGLNRIFGKTLNPYEAIIGALTFLTLVSFLAIYRIKANTFVYATIRNWIKKIRRFIISKGNL